MTVTSTINKIIYTGDGSTTIFPYTFKVFDSSHLTIQKYTIADGTLETLVETTDYSVSGVGTSGGNVTLVSAISSDYKLIIRRVLPITNQSDLVENDNSSAEVQEETHDKAVMRDQQLQEQIDRCVKGDASNSTGYTLPVPIANKYIGWDSDGSALENKDSDNDEAAASAAAAAASAVSAAASAAAANGATGTFTDADLSAGVLTITHNLGLSSPYVISFNVVDNNAKEIEPDDVTYAANTITVDLGSYGTLSGTWGYFYGGSPSATIPLPDPTGETALNVLRVNAGQTAYESVDSTASITETNTGTETFKGVTPDALAGSYAGTKVVELTCFDYTTDVETGDGAGYFHIPACMNGMNLVSVHAEVITAGTTGTTDIEIYNVTQTTDMLSTTLTIDSGETGSDTAATAAVIDTDNDDVATNDLIRVDVDAISTTAPKGLIVTMEFRLP